MTRPARRRAPGTPQAAPGRADDARPGGSPAPAPGAILGDVGGLPGRRWTIEIDDYHPIRLNQLIGCHWATVRRRKDSVYRTLRWRSLDIPRAAGRRRVTLRLTLGPRQRAGDPDAYWKALLDACVRLGLLVDDSRTWVELAPVEFERGERKRTVIELEDIPAAGPRPAGA